MSNFALTDEQRQFRRHHAPVRRRADGALRSRGRPGGRVPLEVLRGLLSSWSCPSLGIPEAYGGAGADMVTQAIVAEELARVCASTSLTILISKLGMLPVMNWASEELKQRYLPRVATGELQASYCLSEADAGSDVGIHAHPGGA